MPKRPDTYMAERRHQILDAMKRCVARLGWEGATINEVAREAGLSKGAVYVHFRSKRALLVGMVERSFAGMEERAKRVDLPTLRAEIITDILPLLQPEGWRAAVGIVETWTEGVRDPEIRTKIGRGGDLFADLMAAMVQRQCPDLGSEDARLWALGLFALTNGLAALCSFDMSISESDLRKLLEAQFRPILAMMTEAGQKTI